MIKKMPTRKLDSAGRGAKSIDITMASLFSSCGGNRGFRGREITFAANETQNSTPKCSETHDCCNKFEIQLNVVSAVVLARSASAFVTIWAGEEASSASASPLEEEEARRRGGSREGGLERELEFVRRMGRSASALERSATFEYSPHYVYVLWWPNSQKLDVGRDTRTLRGGMKR